MNSYINSVFINFYIFGLFHVRSSSLFLLFCTCSSHLMILDSNLHTFEAEEQEIVPMKGRKNIASDLVDCQAQSSRPDATCQCLLCKFILCFTLVLVSPLHAINMSFSVCLQHAPVKLKSSVPFNYYNKYENNRTVKAANPFLIESSFLL